MNRYIEEELAKESARMCQQQAVPNFDPQNYQNRAYTYKGMGLGQQQAQVPEHILLRARVRELEDLLKDERERCAKIAETVRASVTLRVKNHYHPTSCGDGWYWAADSIAAKIREGK